MARFDIYKYNSSEVPYVLEIQADLFDNLLTTVVIPLTSSINEALPKLKPVITVEDKEFLLITTDISAIKRSTLGKYIATLSDNEKLQVTEALDFLFQGF